MSRKNNPIRYLSGARGRNRTTDTRIFNFPEALCRLKHGIAVRRENDLQS